MAEPPLILVTGPSLVPIRPWLEAQPWRVATLDELGEGDLGQVRAMAHIGPFCLTPDILLSLPRPNLLAIVTAGYDGIDVAWCRANGIEVTHAQGVNADDAADVALGLLIAAWRDLVEGHSRVREGRWSFENRVTVLRPGLAGRKVGIVGMGHIGQAVARRVEACGMQVAWWGPNPKPVSWPRADSLLALAADSDILVVASRAAHDNRGMIDAAVIEAVGPQGLIVNIARGSLIDEDALIAALKDGRLGLAALDVFEQEPTPAVRWAGVPNVVFAPHVGGATSDTIASLAGQTIENVRRWLAGEPLLSPAAA